MINVDSFYPLLYQENNNFGCHLKTLMSGKLRPTLVNSLIRV